MQLGYAHFLVTFHALGEFIDWLVSRVQTLALGSLARSHLPVALFAEWRQNKASQGLKEQMELQDSRTCDKDFIISVSHTPSATSLSESALFSGTSLRKLC